MNFVSVVSLLLFRTAEAKLQIPLDNRPLATVKHGDPFTNDFAKFVDGVMEDWKVPGMSIAVIDGDDVYTEVYYPYKYPPSLSVLNPVGLRLRDTAECTGYAGNPVHDRLNFESLHRSYPGAADT